MRPTPKSRSIQSIRAYQCKGKSVSHVSVLEPSRSEERRVEYVCKKLRSSARSGNSGRLVPQAHAQSRQTFAIPGKVTQALPKNTPASLAGKPSPIIFGTQHTLASPK